MASPQKSVDSNPLATEDPWNWGVDEVVTAICNRQTPLLNPDDYRAEYPAGEFLEGIIRDNEIGGATLLKDVDNKSMREDLGISKFGHRGAIQHVITLLRYQSPKYFDTIHMASAESRISGHASLTYPRHENVFGYRFPGSPVSPGQYTPTYVPLAQSVRTEHSVHGQDGEVPAVQGRTSQSPRKFLREARVLPQTTSMFSAPVAGSKLDETSGYARGIQEECQHIAPCEEDTTNPNESMLERSQPRSRCGEIIVVEHGGRKKRRLTLGPPEPLTPPSEAEPPRLPRETFTSPGRHELSSPLDRHGGIEPCAFTNQGHMASSKTVDEKVEPESDNGNGASGVMMRDLAGRKRIKPILVSQTTEKNIYTLDPLSISYHGDTSKKRLPKSSDVISGPADDDKPGQHWRRSTADIYCGLKALPVDYLFYGDTPLNQHVNHETNRLGSASEGIDNSDADNFAFHSPSIYSDGQRLYVNNRMKYFLLSDTLHRVQHNDNNAYVRLPYPERVARPNTLMSATEFLPSSLGCDVLRKQRLNLDNSRRSAKCYEDSDMDFFNVPEKFTEKGDATKEDFQHLEKWSHQASEDKVLPLFGDSGSEGEYDLDTWREMELEQGKLARSAAPKSRRRKTSDEDVNNAIDTAIKKIVDDWRSKQLPKIQMKAWGIWMNSRKQASKQQQIDRLQVIIADLDERISKMRKEILGETWPSARHVFKQCNILQPSLYDKQERQWKISLLQSKRPPEKPVRNLAVKTKKPKAGEEPLADGEEIIGSSDESSHHDSEDEISDSIVDDEVLDENTNDDDVAMADVEDEGLEYLEPACHSSHWPSANGATPATADPGNERPLNLGQSILSRKKANARVSSAAEPPVIDLTQASDTINTERSPPKHSASTAIRTPPLNPRESSDESVRGIKQRPTSFKRPPVSTDIINLESDSIPDDVVADDSDQMPDLTDFGKISRMSAKYLEKRQDRERLLIYAITRTPDDPCAMAYGILMKQSHTDLHFYVREALEAYIDGSMRVSDFDSNVSDAYMLLAAWFVCWAIPVALSSREGIDKNHVRTALAFSEGFEQFFEFLSGCLERYQTPSHLATQSFEGLGKQAGEQRDAHNEISFATPTKKRKHIVQESQEALDFRKTTRNRVKDVKEREERAQALSSRLRKMGVNEEHPTKVIVNPGKDEEQDFIYLNPKIGKLIQPHQKEGVQFLWRELTGDHENMQGCLLAHTMGLGKTMQVITVLVTIAEAAKSPDQKTWAQVPEPLRKSQTMILCPPSLIDNWYDEFLMWTPSPINDSIGEIRKVTSGESLDTRISDIEAWSQEGGILLIGFTSFRELIHNSFRKLDPEHHQLVKRALLEKPTLVVADEAHTAKNLATLLSKAMNQVHTRSRIALTGSPLANNVEEYYALIDWIAPNYLGDHIEFKANYAEPIHLGSYKDCSVLEHIEARKRLKALQSELEPKVHRADITVLKGKLKGKTEFLMKMPLTDLQMALYAEYVDWMLGVARREEPETSTLWAWLGELRLLCNHPLCFAERLEEKLKAKQELATNTQEHRPLGKKKRKSNSVLDESDLITSGDERTVLAAARGPAVSTTMMDKQLEIIKKLDVPLDSASLALKMQVLEQILEFARKAGDKALVFSHSLRTLTFIASMLRKKHVESIRIDGGVMTSKRQEIVKNFNTGPITVALISTTAGGQGLNMFGANRVIIIDTNYSPQWEEQAVGRAYRMGQKKHVYVYRLTAGGTFEEAMLNQAVFKQQLATRVVDKKNPLRYATKGSKQFLFHPKVLEQRNLDSFIGKDPFVLDKLLNTYSTNPVFRSIELTETFQEEDTIELTAEQVREANELAAENQLRRRDPAAYQAKIVERQRQKDLELGAYAQSRYASASTQAAQHCGVLNDPASNAHTTYSNGSLGPPVDVACRRLPKVMSQLSFPHHLVTVRSSQYLELILVIEKRPIRFPREAMSRFRSITLGE